MAESPAAIRFDRVSIVFGRKAQQQAAFAALDEGADRQTLLARTGAVLGCADISLTVKRGEIFVLMGLSGSGKSTLLRGVNGLNPVARGVLEVRHQGEMIDITRCPTGQLRAIRRQSVAMVFQSFGLLPWRSVAENVAFGLELRGMPRAERMRIVAEKLEMVGLSPWAAKPVGQLSGGMQQRVGLARAFATDADILLMDEPFSALDPLIRSRLQDELLDLQARIHKTILFVSHDLDEAMKLGNRIAILEGGRLLQAGPGEEILRQPADAHVARFVAHINPLGVVRAGAIMVPAPTLPRRPDRPEILELQGPAGRLGLRLSPEDRLIAAGLGEGAEQPLPGVLNGHPVRLDLPGGGAPLCVAGVDLLLRDAVALKAASPWPLVLLDAEGRLAGICGDREIYAGLMQSPSAPAPKG